MPRALWSGSISFGLVNIPVQLFNAVKDRGVHFHLLHAKDGARLRQKLVCSADGEDVPDIEVAKGYEVSRDRYVIVDPDELADMLPKSTRAIEIQDFVDIVEIDPIYYNRPYYLLPGEGGEKAYSLLVKVMSDAGKVGIGRVVMRNKEYVAALRPVGGAICLETMRFDDEVTRVEELEGFSSSEGAEKRELAVAQQLVDMLSGDFKPDKYREEYREAVMDLVRKKAEGEEIVTPPPVEEPGKVIDLMSALEESLSRAKRSRARKSAAK